MTPINVSHTPDKNDSPFTTLRKVLLKKAEHYRTQEARPEVFRTLIEFESALSQTIKLHPGEL